MRYSSVVDRLDGPGAAAWAIHSAAVEAHRNGADVIFASVGDPDHATPSSITARAIEALELGDTHYTDVPGRPALRGAIAGHLSGQGLDCKAENVVVLAGAQNGLFAASLCLFEAGDEIIVLEPAYVTYEATFALTGARLVRVGTDVDAGFRLDARAVAAAVTPRTRGILFANPNNPTGVVMLRSELEQIARIAIDHDLWVVVDEVYSSLVFERPHVSLAALPGMADRTATIGSLSKSHAMTGWRVGWVAGPQPLIRHVEHMALNMLYGLPGFIQEAALAAFENYDGIVAEMLAAYKIRRDIVTTGLSGIPGLRVLVPEAGMFVLLDVRAMPMPPNALAWALFRETGVSVLDATAFGEAAYGFLRMSFALGDDALREACRRIRGFCLALPLTERIAPDFVR